MNIRTVALLLCLSPSAVLACQPGEKLVFSCSTDRGKQVEVCQGPTAIRYSYGRPGQPVELKLSEKNQTFVWEHAEGVGSGVGDDLLFKNGATHYIISHVSNFDDITDTEAHILVRQPGKEDAYIQCASGKAKFNAKAIKAQPREMSEGIPSF
jgi:hypothetical protein